jgi:hypothetical protein
MLKVFETEILEMDFGANYEPRVNAGLGLLFMSLD